MVSFVLDSSIALSWLMPDEVASLDILDKTITEEAIVPAIWELEIGNVLLCAERAKRLTINQRHQAIYTLKDLYIKIDQITLEHIWFETMDLAVQYGLTLYDASYLELALRCGLPIATLDKSLKQASKAAGVVVL
ncbi:type II toxin-antitoxin system VapC family toxin [Rickettsia argasii]|uniref:PIN domain protein n=1 Tax=Rickettsia argasii T170-B TaxID=1268837 RepID=A0A0F3REC1_9RICK|nr:type II toxin-antitoxin system VapC family toxin [Rickettsia argasii]KJW04351.1 PIN domain protein [Rickettsia argasii T170-B]